MLTVLLYKPLPDFQSKVFNQKKVAHLSMSRDRRELSDNGKRLAMEAMFTVEDFGMLLNKHEQQLTADGWGIPKQTDEDIREVEQEWEQELAEQWLDGEARDFYFNLDRKVKDVEASAKTFHHNGRSQHHTEYKDKLADFSGNKVIVSNNHFVYHKGGT